MIQKNKQPFFVTVWVGETSLTAEVASTAAQQSKGLSGRAELSDGSGMLFVYSAKEIRNFWMKDMNFSLDVLWIANGEVVGLERGIKPASAGEEIPRFRSNLPADTVLEVKDGWIDQNGIKVGDRVKIDQN